MKKLILSTGLICISATFGFGQKSKTTAAAPVEVKKNTPKPKIVSLDKSKQNANQTKSVPTKIVAPVKTTAVISDVEWKTLTDSLIAEDWDKSAALGLQFTNRIKIDNEKKQLAQLRYLYVYALAGKLFKLSAVKNAAESTAIWEELKRAAARFTNKEFVLPPRQFLGDCRQVFNYICTVKADEKALRSVSTDKKGTEIHSFDYVRFDQKIGFREFKENKIFVGGTIRRVEFNEDLAKPWVMRLVFDKGFARVVI